MTRIVDIFLVILVTPVLIPLFLIVLILVRINLGTPVFYSQPRGGLDGATFRIWKFRSMTNECDDNGNLLPDEGRLTSFGRQLRRFRLDELPAFCHILTGELSLVGPRPLLWAAINSHPLGYKRLAGKPGFTGLSQVSGNTKLTETEKFALDCYYLAHRSIWFDAIILLRTFWVILSGEKRNEDLIGQAKKEFPEYFEVEGAR